MASDCYGEAYSCIKNKYILATFGCMYSAELGDAMNGTIGQLFNC